MAKMPLESQIDRALRVLAGQTKPVRYIVRPPRPRGGKRRGGVGPRPVKEAVGWAIVDGDLVLERHFDKRTAASRAKAMRAFARGYNPDWDPDERPLRPAPREKLKLPRGYKMRWHRGEFGSAYDVTRADGVYIGPYDTKAAGIAAAVKNARYVRETRVEQARRSAAAKKAARTRKRTKR